MRICRNCNSELKSSDERLAHCSEECRRDCKRKRDRARNHKYRLNPRKALSMNRKDRERKNRWRKENPEKADLARKKQGRSGETQRRRSRKKGLPTGLRASDWRAAVEHFRGCAYCGAMGKTEQEHFIPMVSDGGFTRDNIIPACRGCNLEKSTQAALDYLVSKEHGLARYAGILSYFEGLN